MSLFTRELKGYTPSRKGDILEIIACGILLKDNYVNIIFLYFYNNYFKKILKSKSENLIYFSTLFCIF